MILDAGVPYQLHNSNLGDHWTSYCLMLRLGQLHGRSYLLGTHNGGIDHTYRLREIEELFSEQQHRPTLVQQQGYAKVDPWLNWCYPAVPVNKNYLWSENFRRMESRPLPYSACYQFDGLSSAEDKNPPPSLVADMKQYLKNYGLQLIRLGSHLSLAKCAEALSQCALFVGCDSGMSHIAHSVGCPVYMYEGRLPTYTCHKLKQADLFRDLPEFRMKTEHWIQLLRL